MWFNITATKIGNNIRLKEIGSFLHLFLKIITVFLKKQGDF